MVTPAHKINISTCQQSTKSEQPVRSRDESGRAAQKIWDLLTQYLTDKWIKRNGAKPSDLWINEISLLTDEQIRMALMKIRENIRSGNKWAPDLSEFLAIVHGRTETDYDGAYFRCLQRAPEGRIEQWVYERAWFNIRSATDDTARKMHRRFMHEAEELERAGKLTTHSEELKALPRHSVKNLNDIEREKFEASHGRAINDRIQSIINSKKATGD